MDFKKVSHDVEVVPELNVAFLIEFIKIIQICARNTVTGLETVYSHCICIKYHMWLWTSKMFLWTILQTQHRLQAVSEELVFHLLFNFSKWNSNFQLKSTWDTSIHLTLGWGTFVREFFICKMSCSQPVPLQLMFSDEYYSEEGNACFVQ